MDRIKARSELMSRIRAKDTGPELTFRKALWKAGLRGYRIHRKDLPGRPDIVFGRYRVAIFIHGCFWHACPKCDLPVPKTNSVFWKEKFERNKARDVRKEQQLRDLHYAVVIIRECEMKKDLDDCVEKVRLALVECR